MCVLERRLGNKTVKLGVGLSVFQAQAAHKNHLGSLLKLSGHSLTIKSKFPLWGGVLPASKCLCPCTKILISRVDFRSLDSLNTEQKEDMGRPVCLRSLVSLGFIEAMAIMLGMGVSPSMTGTNNAIHSTTETGKPGRQRRTRAGKTAARG